MWSFHGRWISAFWNIQSLWTYVLSYCLSFSPSIYTCLFVCFCSGGFFGAPTQYMSYSAKHTLESVNWTKNKSFSLDIKVTSALCLVFINIIEICMQNLLLVSVIICCKTFSIIVLIFLHKSYPGVILWLGKLVPYVWNLDSYVSCWLVNFHKSFMTR